MSIINIRQQLTNGFHLAGFLSSSRDLMIPVPTEAEGNPENLKTLCM